MVSAVLVLIRLIHQFVEMEGHSAQQPLKLVQKRIKLMNYRVEKALWACVLELTNGLRLQQHQNEGSRKYLREVQTFLKEYLEESLR